MTTTPVPDRTDARRAKFRQAAFVYLHVAVLYEAAVWAVHGAGRLPAGRGPVAVWLVIGALIAGAIFWGLWFRRSVWLARIVWALVALRLPALIGGAFLPAEDASLPPSFYLAALVVVTVNLWMLARAGWDL